ncbi:MAG: MerR family transcriptional regulator [Sphingobacteriaceae bacterium]|nr:MerR family transcriptional regulator [Sphingobacteriaceae bacterium]
MPYKSKPIEKSYYSIGEVAELLGVSQSLIRFWETEFEQLQPKKNRKGNRIYTPANIEQLRTIYHLVKERGYTLKGAREMLKSKAPVVDKQLAVRESLLKIRSFLTELKSDLDAGDSENPNPQA